MIEENIIKWIELGDSIQSMDIYEHPKLLKFFNFMRFLVKFEDFPIVFYMFFHILSLMQYAELALLDFPEQNDDYVLYIIYYFKKFFLPSSLVTSESSYKVIMIILIAIVGYIIVFLLLLYIEVSREKIRLKFFYVILNLLLLLTLNYLMGPVLEICIQTIKCKDGLNIITKETCFEGAHMVKLIIMYVFFVIFLCLTVILGIYYNEIGRIIGHSGKIRNICLYEIYVILSKTTCFAFYAVFKYFGEQNKIYRVILLIYIFFNMVVFTIYLQKAVFFYDRRILILMNLLYPLLSWFTLVVLLKTLFDLYETSVFNISGFVLISIIKVMMILSKEEFFVTKFNVFECKDVREFEYFKEVLIKLTTENGQKAKAMLYGYIKQFEENISNLPELYEKYRYQYMDQFLRAKFANLEFAKIYSIINISYQYHIEKSEFKNELIIYFCYFLTNKIDNPTFAMYLLSAYKFESHMHLYYKYFLMEEIQEDLVNKMNRSLDKASVKSIQLGSAILYHLYIEMFKLRIFDATSCQIEYFDCLKSSVTTQNTMKTFLKTGNDILKLRTNIIKIWEKITCLNPFSDEIKRNYLLYLKTILQDEKLAKSESKKFLNLKNSKMNEKNNIYYSMFNEDNSAVLLIDGYSNNGKILYYTPNFPQMFLFHQKEMISVHLNDLLPNVVKEFHNELMNFFIKYSNVEKFFDKHVDVLLKGKNGNLFNIYIFVKCIPNLTYGLCYMAYISKKKEGKFQVILDKDLKIAGFTETNIPGESFTINNNYGLGPSLIGHNIALCLPDILFQMQVDEKGKLIIPKSEFDLKGNLYPVVPWRELSLKVNYLLEIIKEKKCLVNKEDNENFDENEEEKIIEDYQGLLEEMNKKYSESVTIHYSVDQRTFIYGKHVYYRIYIMDDLDDFQIGCEKGEEDEKTINKKAKKKDSNSLENYKGTKGKEIPFKNVGSQKEEEEDELNKLEKEKDEINDIRKKNVEEKNIDENNVDKLLDTKSKSSQQSSANSENSVFNKLKLNIIEKKETKTETIMKFVSVLVGIFSIFFMILDSIENKNNFERLAEFLNENLYFNHSKISSTCIYNAVIHLHFLKNGYIDNDKCETDKCVNVYASNLFKTSLDLKQQKENFSNFFNDYQAKLKMIDEIELDRYRLESTNKITVNINYLVNLLVYYAIKLKSSPNLYLSDDEYPFDIAGSNLIKQSLQYVNYNVTGFKEKEKRHKVKENFTIYYYEVIIIAIISFIFVVFLSYLVMRNYKMEIYFLEKLINFNPPSFEEYLKYLEDLKKRLRNNSEEDDDEDDEMLQHKDESDKNNENNDKDNQNNIDNDKENKKNKRRNKKGNKSNKLIQQKKKKKQIMASYFYKFNLFFIIKITCIVIIFFTYYLVSMVLDYRNKNSFLKFDISTDKVEGIFKDSYDLYASLLSELAAYEESLFSRKEGVKALKAGNKTYVTFLNKNYTNYQDLERAALYPMVYSKYDETPIPKLGSELMPYITNLKSQNSPEGKLNTLYNGDVCSIIFETDSKEYNSCTRFWSGVLTKGLQQGFTQMGVLLSSVLDEFNKINETDSEENLKEALGPNGSIYSYTAFMEFYFYSSYLKTVELFNEMRNSRLNKIKSEFDIILCVYIIICFICVLIMIYFVLTNRHSFFNFVGIIPYKYFSEDEKFLKETLKLQEEIY